MPAADIDARFEVLARIGRGSWGEVHRARDRETGEDVAIKRLHGHVDDEQAVERFHREARLLARVTSPHVVRFIAAGVDERGAPYLVTEWLAGEDLARRQRRAPLNGVEMISVARQIARGLDALHLAGIVHRDVKPSNVFLAEDPAGGEPCAKLIDLGVARGPAEHTLTVQGVAVGTPYYMSPEQARGDEEITAASDVFSLGVVLFELCAGKRPFRGDDLFAVLAKIVLTDPPRLHDEAPDAPPELAAVVARALSKDATARFASARELDDALATVPPFRMSAADRTLEEREEVDTIVGTQALSGSLEQRVVTAVFAKLALRLDDAGPKAAFAAIAIDGGGAPYPLLGRNVVALFGGYRTTGDEVGRAARAALRAAIELPGARIAIATGRAIADVTGLAGAVIERGAAELDRAQKGVVHIDAITMRLLGDGFDVELRGEARVLVGERAAREAAAPRSLRTLLGKPTPCVGRDRELAMLDALFAECADESVARAALITGPAGSGKSRLRTEFLQRIANAGASTGREPLVLFGRGDALSAGSPFALLGSAIRRAAGVVEAEPLEARAEKVRAFATRSAPPADAPAIADGLSEIAATSGRRDGADAMVAADRIRAAWEMFLVAEASARPVVLVLEDLHAGDLSSVRLVDAALLACAASPLLVVAFARPEIAERFPNLWAGRDGQRMPLPPLGKRAAERLVRAALGEAAPEAVVARVVDRADGNAFFLEELIRAVADHGPDAPMPDTVLGVVQARLDALGADAKRLLRAASVFGDAFWRGGVSAVLGSARSVAGRDELDDLAAREIVTKRAVARFAGEAEYVFRHQLVRDASYATLIEGDRALAHRLAATWLEAVGERDAVTLAEHHARGDRPEAARKHWLTAAEQALYGSDFVAASSFAQRARAGGNDALAGAALLVDAEAHRWRGELAEASDRAIAATACLAKRTAPWFQALREVIVANGRLARHDAVEGWANKSSQAEPAPGAEGAQIGSLAPAAVYLTYAGREEGAERLAARVEALVAAAVDLEPVLLARVHQLRGVRAGHRLDAEGALLGHTAALEAFTLGGDARNAALTGANIGFALGQLGQLDAAEEALRRAHATAERLRLLTIGPLALHNLGLVLANLGRVDEAREVEGRAVVFFAQQGDTRLERASRVYLARILDLAGDAAGAEREARAVLETAEGGTARVGALAIVARAQLAHGDDAGALATASEANDLLATTPIEEWEWESLTRMALVDALDRVGQRDIACRVLGGALDRLASRVGSLRDVALRDSAVARVPEHARMLARARALGVEVPPVLGPANGQPAG